MLQGAAALITVELDDIMGGAPVQHREVQGHETKGFIEAFGGKPIEYQPGGCVRSAHNFSLTSHALLLASGPHLPTLERE